MSIPLFLKYWHMVEKKQPLFDPVNTYFDGWQDDQNTICYGIRQRDTEEIHGIVRKSSPIGFISEACYKNGVKHGISRAVWPYKIELFVHRDGECVAYMAYDRNMQEIHRSGRNVELLKDLSVSDFLPPEITHEPEWETEECDASARELETEMSPQLNTQNQPLDSQAYGSETEGE